MLVAAGYADETLVADLAQGFPLIGKLLRSNTLPEVSYPLVEETRESLLWQAGWRNDEILSRVAASFVSDVEVAAELDAKSQSEVESGKPSEVPLAEVVKRCVVTLRFPVEENWRLKEDKWLLRVRCIDVFTARLSSMQLRQLGNPFTMTRWMFLWRCGTTRVTVVSLFISKASSARTKRSTSFQEFRTRCYCLATRAVLYERCNSIVAPFHAVPGVHAWHRFWAAVQFGILANLFLDCLRSLRR